MVELGGNVDNPLPLTRKNLALLNSLNGNSSSIKNSAYFENDTMKPISTTASGFEQQAYENGILDPTASKPPHDVGTVQHHLTKRRSSTQPSERTHEQYCQRVFRSFNEAEASHLIQSKIMIDYEDSSMHYGRSTSRAITQIPQQDFNMGLSNPLPDILEGLITETLPSSMHGHSLHSLPGNSRPPSRSLDSNGRPSSSSLALCHFATELKRKDGNLRQAVSQAAYDGATLVYARDQALAQATAGTSAAVDKVAGETAVLTCVTDGKVAEVFAHHFQNGVYHQNLVASESLLSYPNRGRELIRNAQDYARRKAYEMAALLGANLKEEEEEE
ncbi:hypothetical protein B0T25DRAFT_454123 [Lasiosphaeria hispida]|uniref:Uncharacterized protein n=1 Tax=Lasiosphaeria hispida TaxID=260671 RepID=A0AAJ0HHE7_9PEZI|nr:hypothetical protein B0T25DRAFT_454123 [Lasiosphaeria hispida]